MLRSVVYGWLLSGCSAAPPAAPAPPSAPPVVPLPLPPAAPLEPAPATSEDASAAPVPAASEDASAAPAPAPDAACPPGMQHVSTSFCPDLERECIEKEQDQPNRITICHAFREAPGECRAPRVDLDYCIDRYEFPNREGERPPVMVSFYEAEQSCAQLGKRLCLESEWVAACEGPEETPFPYGYRRSAEKCNIDNKWLSPSLPRVYSEDAAVQRAELARLDRSLPSGAKPECKSGFGVYDLTGNVDEWVRADVERKNRRSRFAALKGGAWGHVRNACRPVTTSHAPSFEYYFIGFRCCADAQKP